MRDSKLYRRVSTKGLSATPEVQRHPPAFRALWSAHIQSCLRREIANVITVDDYVRLASSSCAYCSRPPCNETKYRSTANLLYNGVDRVDNTLPYELGNVVTCCKTCNAMKRELGTAEFLEHCHRVAVANPR